MIRLQLNDNNTKESQAYAAWLSVSEMCFWNVVTSKSNVFVYIDENIIVYIDCIRQKYLYMLH